MNTKKVRAWTMSAGIFVLLAGSASMFLFNVRHPNGLFGGLIRPAYYESTDTADVTGYMNNFNALAESDEMMQWQLYLRDVEAANNFGHGVYAYEAIDPANNEHVLVLWAANIRHNWSGAAGVTPYIAKVRNRCPRFCDFTNLRPPPGTPNWDRPTPEVCTLVEKGDAMKMIGRYIPHAHFKVWGVYLSSKLIKSLETLCANGTFCITMAAMKADGGELRAIISPTDASGAITYGDAYISRSDQIMASGKLDRPN